jgi:CheY-like chemotaxis protein
MSHDVALISSILHRVLLVEDHPVVRRGLCQLIDQKPALAICDEAESVAEVVATVTTNHPDLVIVDIGLKGAAAWFSLRFSMIARRTGLHLRARDQTKVEQAIGQQIRNMQNPVVYYQFLTTSTPESRHEWEALMPWLSIGETYFFRDQGQCALLANQILPELIRQHGT